MIAALSGSMLSCSETRSGVSSSLRTVTYTFVGPFSLGSVLRLTGLDPLVSPRLVIFDSLLPRIPHTHIIPPPPPAASPVARARNSSVAIASPPARRPSAIGFPVSRVASGGASDADVASASEWERRRASQRDPCRCRCRNRNSRRYVSGRELVWGISRP